MSQSLEVFQAGITDLSVLDTQRLQVRKPFQVFQPEVRDLSAAEPKRSKLSQSLEVFQAGVGDLGTAQGEGLESRQSFEVFQDSFQFRIANIWVAKLDARHLGEQFARGRGRLRFAPGQTPDGQSERV